MNETHKMERKDSIDHTFDVGPLAWSLIVMVLILIFTLRTCGT